MKQTINATYNTFGDTATCFVVEKDGGYWYAFDGSKVANFTYTPLEDGVDTMTLDDVDTMTLADGTFESEEDLEREINEDEDEYNEDESFSTKELIRLGFSLEKEHKLGNEFLAIASPEIIKTLENKGITKTWGHEGNLLSYAEFVSDNKEHPDFGKTFISIYANDNPSKEEILDYKFEKNIIDSLYITDYSEDVGEFEIGDTLTLKGKLQAVANSLKNEAFHPHNENKFNKNEAGIIADHMMGLPSYLNVDFENYKILEIGKEFGVDLSTEEKEDAFLETWFKKNADALCRLFDENGIDVRADNSIFEKVETNEVESLSDLNVVPDSETNSNRHSM